MQALVRKALGDLFSPATFGFILKSTVAALLTTALLMWLFNGLLKGLIASYLHLLPWAWLQDVGLAVALVMFAYMLFIALLSLFTSLFIEKHIVALARKHYPEVLPAQQIDTFGALMVNLKATALFLLLFLVTFPLAFVPFLGAVWLLYLWSIPLKAPSYYDIVSLFPKAKESDTKGLTLLAMIAALFNYIPLLNLFTPLFAEILFLHRLLGFNNEN